MRGSSGSSSSAGAQPTGAVGGRSGRQLGSVQPKEGEFWDRNELPKRFRRAVFSEAESEDFEPMQGMHSRGASGTEEPPAKLEAPPRGAAMADDAIANAGRVSPGRYVHGLPLHNVAEAEEAED